ncbi:PucR family transcriptional regulator [Nonomuraea ferruginea]
MTTRPRASLGRILQDLGSTVLDVAAAPGDLDAEVTGVHIYDPHDEPMVAPGGIVLAVGVRGADGVRALLERAPRAAGIVVKLPVEVDERVRAAVTETGVAVLGLTRAASWSQVAALLRSLLAEGDLDGPEDEPQGDLFSLANAVCALLDAPVTIEDRSSRVLAFSGRAGRGRPRTRRDRARPSGARALPAHARRARRAQGALPEPRPHPHRAARRHARPGRRRRPLRRRDPRLDLGRGGRAAHRAAAARPRRRRQDRGAAAAARPGGRRRPAAAPRRPAVHRPRRRDGRGRGGGPARHRHPAAVRARRPAHRPAGRRPRPRRERPPALLRRARPARRHHPPEGRRRARRLRRVRRAAAHRGPGGRGGPRGAHRPGLPGPGRPPATPPTSASATLVSTLAQASRSRADADRALRVLRARGTSGQAAATPMSTSSRCCCRSPTWLGAEEQTPTGPYQRLLEHDREHGSELAATLRAYLDAFGDVNAASARVHVHANTFRYRLKRLVEISGLDLSDPEARLTVMLQMRIFGP